MAPWESRLFSTDSLGHGTQANMSESPLPTERGRGSSQISEADLLQHAYGIPVLYPTDSRATPFHGTNEQRPSRHGRSMSHPFPSIFHSKKKLDRGNVAMGCDTEDSDGSMAFISHGQSKSTTSKPAKAADRDLTTGKCMTCDSMVRWPKDLAVFRCTVCLTINDLTPIGSRSADYRRPGHSTADSPYSHNMSSSRVLPPISMDRTSALIERCIKSYITSRLRYENTTGIERSTAPAHSSGHGCRLSEMSQEHDAASEDNEHEVSQVAGLSQPMRIAARDSESSTASRANFYSRSTPLDHERHLCMGSPKISTMGSQFEHSIRTPPRLSDVAEIPSSDRNENRQPINSNESSKNIFKPLEDYIAASFKSHHCINRSFSTQRPVLGPRAASEGGTGFVSPITAERRFRTEDMLSPMDEKTLLIGDFAENGAWWTGGRDISKLPHRARSHRGNGAENSTATLDSVNSRSPKIDWAELSEWYALVTHAGHDWERHLVEILASDATEIDHLPLSEINSIRTQITEAQSHTRRVLLKATESLLKRPGGFLVEPGDIRFLLIILANPLLYPSSSLSSEDHHFLSRPPSKNPHSVKNTSYLDASRNERHPKSPIASADSSGPGNNSGITKRVLGLLSNISNESHHHLVAWFSRFSEVHFRQITELVGSFVTYRLTRQHRRRRDINHDPTGGLVPNVSASGHGASAALHAALGVSGHSAKLADGKPKPVVYNDDWQIKAAARVMALLFAANNSGINHHSDARFRPSVEKPHSLALTERERGYRHGQILCTSDFYNTLLDYSDLIADFEAWEAKRGKFTFCQYPFFLSIWAKIQIMEHDARRQMEVKAREAFFDSIMTRKSVNQYLTLKIRRECLVEDSLKGVSEVVGAGGEEIKKGLRIEFKGEEGIDAGGLRKEWFLLLVRDVFNPDHGMFAYDEDSHACYFNPNSFETSDQFFLVGVVLGLAIYNSTILDVALPPFAFRKLLAAGPSALPGAPSHAKPTMVYTLEDLAEYRPSLAQGLRQLLDFDGDVEETFCRDFVADVERYGQIHQVPLCPDGEKRIVNNSNRKEFVDLYVKYLLDTAVIRQFEPFKRGFFTVCGGNALSLFRPEEIELLIRGSDEPLDISSLQAVSVYDNWGVSNPAETEPVILWFWQSFENAQPRDQRKLLSFITGSDRIPAMGATNLVIKLSCLGDDSMRFPVARTCFNMLSLWRYNSRQKLERMLWRAVNESEGFGLK